MTNQDLVESRMTDARRFLEYAERALADGFFHHVIQFAQRAAELAIKALLAKEGKDAPHVHDLAKLVSTLPVVRNLPSDTQSRLYSSNRDLARERLTSIYGSDEGVPPEELYEREEAEKALKQGGFVVSTVEALISAEGQARDESKE